MALRNTVIADLYFRFVNKFIVPQLVHFSISPNQITISGLILAMLVPLGFCLHPVVGFFIMGLSGMTDSLDGLIARTQAKESSFGAFLDSSLDRASDFFYLMGFWVLFWDQDAFILASAIIFINLLFTFMISYLKAKADVLKCICNVGLLERGLRTVYLLVWALALSILPGYLTEILWVGLILYALLALLTVLQRINQIHSNLKHPLT